MIALALWGILTLTAPDGSQVHVMRESIFSVRPATTGDHPRAKTIIQSLITSAQAVRETPEQVLAMLQTDKCK